MTRIDAQKQIEKIEDRITYLKGEMDRLGFEMSNTKIKALKIEKQDEINGYKEELQSLMQELTDAKGEWTKIKRFKREICLKNVDYLLTKQNKKLGELEESSGNHPGYLSRMKSGKSNSDPSIEFLMTAADELSVPLELLISSDLTELTSTEEFIMQFLNKVIENTKKDEIDWNRESISELNKLQIQNDMNGYRNVPHPLYAIEDDETDTGYYEMPIYDSLFFGKCGVTPCGNGYNAILAGTNNKIYIMECSKGNDGLVWLKDKFYELYLVETDLYGNYIVKKLCNTLEAGDAIVVTVDSLVKYIGASLNRIHIEPAVKDVLNAYINGIEITASNEVNPWL